MPNTKIVATLGPATDAPGVLRQLLAAGVDVFRLNASHGAQDDHAARIDAVRSAARDAHVHAGILLDLQGPKIRLGRFEDGRAMLETGAAFTITTETGDWHRGARLYGIFAFRQRRDSRATRILLADGSIELVAVESDGISVRTRVVSGGPISDHKGINLPGVQVSIPSLTDKDLADLHFGLTAGVDMIALSFVRTADDVRQLRDRLGGRPITIVAKIEKPEAYDNIESILDVTDGVMVARGDLGVELSLERVPRIQKSIIRRARRKGRFVITATQMLESMIEQLHTHARGGERRCQCDLRRHGCGDAIGGDFGGQVSGGGGALHGEDRRGERGFDPQEGISGSAAPARARSPRRFWPMRRIMRRAIPARRLSWCSRRAARARGWFRATGRRSGCSPSRRTILPRGSFRSVTESSRCWRPTFPVRTKC